MKKYKSVYYAIYDNLKNIGIFKQYLIDNFEIIVCFHFPHGYSKKPSYLEIYENGKLKKTKIFFIYKRESNIVKTFLYYIYFQYILFRFVPHGSYVVVDNPVFCILNSFLGVFKQTKLIYWIGDFYPNNGGFMRVYNTLSKYYNKSLGIVWYVSPPLKAIYESKQYAGNKKDKIRMLVSLGTKAKNIDNRSTPHKPIRLGFVGVIREQQGLDLIFKYLQKYDRAILEIIGDGYKLEHYKNLALKMKLNNKVKFHGYVEDLTKIASSWDIGIALYENSATNVSIYCEPTKIKNYLEFGLPVITTKTTYFYTELEEKKAGLVIDETIESIEEAVRKVSLNYGRYKKGAENILKEYEYTKYYNSLLGFMRNK